MEQTPSKSEQAETALSECIARATGWDASCDRAAAHLAQALVESDTQRGEMFRRLCTLGLSRGAARGLLSNARRVVRNRKLAKENQQFGGATPLCPFCLQRLSPTDHFCSKCCGPVSAHASIHPLWRVYSAGRAYRQAISGEPRLLVLVAMWLIFGPPLLSMFFLVYLRLRALGAFDPQNPWEYVQSDGVFVVKPLGFVLTCALMPLYAAILWKMTARWVNSRMSFFSTRCPKCRTRFDFISDTCPSCGFRVRVGFFRRLVQRAVNSRMSFFSTCCPKCRTRFDFISDTCPSCGFRVRVGFFRRLVQRALYVLLKTRSGKALLIAFVYCFLILATEIISPDGGSPLFVVAVFIAIFGITISGTLFMWTFVGSLKRKDFL